MCCFKRLSSTSCRNAWLDSDTLDNLEVWLLLITIKNIPNSIGNTALESVNLGTENMGISILLTTLSARDAKGKLYCMMLLRHYTIMC